MDESRHGPNTIDVNGITMLLTDGGGGNAVHLTRLADPGTTGRGALYDFYLDDKHLQDMPTRANYDRDALLDPRWSNKTLCGRQWVMMIGGDGCSVSQWDADETAFAPTCRRCLAAMDKLFPPPAPDPRLPVIARVVADLIIEHGFAEVHHIPGDQVETLRKQIRKLVRADSGHPIETHHLADVLYLACDPIYQTHAMEYQREAVEALSNYLHGDGVPREPKARISWTTWSAT